jgi:hypothetical protein
MFGFRKPKNKPNSEARALVKELAREEPRTYFCELKDLAAGVNITSASVQIQHKRTANEIGRCKRLN